MKKSITAVLLMSLLTLSGCNSSNEAKKLTFESAEYVLALGESVKVEQKYKNITYEIVGSNKYNVQIDSKTGELTFGSDVPNGVQVMVIARCGDITSEPIVVTIKQGYQEANITFNNLSDYIVDGEFITAKADRAYAITYSLKDKVQGITIDSSSGKVSFTSAVKNNTPFTVVASTHDITKSEKTFYTLTENFVTVESARQVVELGGAIDATFKVDFSACEDASENGILALTNSRNEQIDSENYTYDKVTKVLKIKSAYLNTLFAGENIFKLVTSRNAVTVNVDIATKFIYTADEIAAINDSVDALSGYYVLMNDIDMESYLAEGGAGYNEGKGWTAIGQYEDVVDANIATKMAFKGTFDGNGHVIRNYKSNRKDVSSFNAGLFGYVTSSAVIKNLGVTGSINVSSYSGGFVGSNSGTITNCWADVDVEVYTGDGVYRYVGGFAGNNFGTIENCFSYGNVKSDTYYGNIVGSNEGEVINCYSVESEDCKQLIGYGNDAINSIQFASIEEMKNYDWSKAKLDENWEIKENDVPSLVSNIKINAVTKYEIDKSVLENDYYPGDKIELNTIIYPTNMSDQYKDQVVYTLEKNGGARFVDNVLNTMNAKTNEFVITSTLVVDGVTYSDTITITLGTKIESLEVVTGTDVMKAGSRYQISSIVNPTNATEKIVYHVTGANIEGVRVDGDVIIIDEDTKCKEFEVYATSASNAVRSTNVKVSVDPITRIAGTTSYEGDTEPAKFTFDSSVNLNGVKVMLDDKVINATVSGNIVSVASSILAEKKDTELVFTFETANGLRFIASAYYFSHARYTLTSVKQDNKDVIELSSKEDFHKYFNLTKEEYSENKYDNYDKVYVLTNDIDFEGEEIFGIGYSRETDVSHPFNGVVYGCGYTISNYTIKSNEYAVLDESNYLFSPKYFGVGLFGNLTGKLYDIKVTGVKVSGRNFVGGLVGMMQDGGYIENCHVSTNVAKAITASEYDHSNLTEGIRVGGVVGRVFGGDVFACTYNNVTKYMIG